MSTSRPVRSAATARVVLRTEAPVAEINALHEQLETVRGMHRVEAHTRDGVTSYLYFRGTVRAVNVGKSLIAFSGLQNPDEHGDHDHAACIARAAAMGVPAEWAHRPETYLSS